MSAAAVPSVAGVPLVDGLGTAPGVVTAVSAGFKRLARSQLTVSQSRAKSNKDTFFFMAQSIPAITQTGICAGPPLRICFAYDVYGVVRPSFY